MEIPSANKMRELSNNSAKIQEITVSLIKEIHEKAEGGWKTASVSIPLGTNEFVRNEIKKRFEEAGYVVEISDYTKTYRGAPSDQSPWYDDIAVDWSQKDE